MGENTNIEWTDVSDNIIVVEGGGWWCRMCSPGCGNCYSARLNQNEFYGGNKLPFTGEPPKLVLRRDLIDGWRRQTRPRRHFVASMTDVFGEWVEREWIFYFLDGMAAAPLQTFQVLTKRPAVAAREIAAWLEVRRRTDLPGNIWIGTSVEDQQRANERVPHLLSIPAAIRFLSSEPLLGPVDLERIVIKDAVFPERGQPPVSFQSLSGWHGGAYRPERTRVDWVIVGGESGPKARPMHPDWVRSLRDQCAIADEPVPFFFKQWGEWIPLRQLRVGWSRTREALHPWGEAGVSYRVGKKEAGRLLDGREWSEFPSTRLEVAR